MAYPIKDKITKINIDTTHTVAVVFLILFMASFVIFLKASICVFALIGLFMSI
jgi:hypothetical protein